jgi:hypothetical protein
MPMMCALIRGNIVSEGGLEPVERPLDKRVSDILSAKMDPGGPGCTPLFRFGALQERTKTTPGMSDPGSLFVVVELGHESVDPGCRSMDREGFALARVLTTPNRLVGTTWR